MDGLNSLLRFSTPFALAGVGLYAVYRALAGYNYRPARALQRKFDSLKPLVGKHRTDIVIVVGAPHSVIQLAHGAFTNRWVAETYAIELRFDANAVCEAVTQEIPA